MKKVPNNLLTILFFIIFLATIGACFYKFYYLQNYKYLVEAQCDPSIETCFVRDCTNPDDCPPNGFEKYKEYYVTAHDFRTCTDNSCKTECESGVIPCEKIDCDESAGDECSIQIDVLNIE